MKTPLQIAFHNLPHSKVIESAIQEAADRLEDTHDRITSCHVIVDQPHRHHKEGNLFQVRIDLKMPGAELVVKREHAGSLASGDLSLVIQDAFEEMQGQIEEFVNRRRGFVKAHEDPSHARVTRLFTEAGYGFLETLDGREVFFHRNSVLGLGFGGLDVGTEVSFVEELGEKGPQASTVKIVGRHNHVYWTRINDNSPDSNRTGGTHNGSHDRT
jgi:cold shock CspA family protein